MPTAQTKLKRKRHKVRAHLNKLYKFATLYPQYFAHQYMKDSYYAETIGAIDPIIDIIEPTGGEAKDQEEDRQARQEAIKQVKSKRKRLEVGGKRKEVQAVKGGLD